MTSKRHYERVAQLLAQERSRVQLGGSAESVAAIAVGLAYIYQDENPRFDRERFLEASRGNDVMREAER